MPKNVGIISRKIMKRTKIVEIKQNEKHCNDKLLIYISISCEL